MICRRCQRWDPRPGDRFCSWCGLRFSGFLVTPEPSRAPLDGFPPPFRLTVRNPLNEPADVLACRTTASWLQFDLPEHGVPFRLKPGQDATLYLRADASHAGPSGGRALAVLETSRGEESAWFELVPEAEVRIETGGYEVFLDNRDLEQNFVRITVSRGETELLAAAIEPAEWARVQLVGDMEFPVQLDARQQPDCYLRLQFDEAALLRRVSQFPAEYEGVLKLEFEDRERVVPFRIRCWRPPEIWIWEEGDAVWTFRAGLSSPLFLTVENGHPQNQELSRGNAPLEILRVEACQLDGSPVPWLIPEDAPCLTMQIDGGQRRKIRFQVHTAGHAGAAGAPPGRHAVLIRLWTNRPDPLKELRVEVRVEPMRAFDGVLALDFGTSNTCCAVMDRQRDGYRLLELDSREHNPAPAVMPTVIQYLERDVVEIGAVVDAKAADPQVAASTVRSLKRLLGRPDRTAWLELTGARDQATIQLHVREAVADYLREIRKRVQEEVQARIDRLIVTYPARFRLQQLRQLLGAVREAFGDECRIETVQEPVAAALDHIVSGGPDTEDQFVLGVFDFGGGTTDLSLLRVHRSVESGITNVRAKLLGSTGRWFGGEDVTRFVLSHALEKCRALARNDQPDAVIPADVEDEDDPVRRYYARRNHFNLHQWAEMTKLLLVEHGDEHMDKLPSVPDILPRLRLWVLSSDNFTDREFPHEELKPSLTALNTYVSREVNEMADLLERLIQQCGESRLDVLVMSGKSSAMPAVASTLQTRFPNCRLAMALNLKECVVAGACARDRIAEAPDMLLEVEELTTTPTRIGLEDPARGLFWEWFPVGKPIPREGLVERRVCLLRTDRPLRLLENSALDDHLWVEGRRSESISELGLYRLDTVPAEYAGARAFRVELELKLSMDLECEIRAYVPDLRRWIPLVRDGEG